MRVRGPRPPELLWPGEARVSRPAQLAAPRARHVFVHPAPRGAVLPPALGQVLLDPRPQLPPKRGLLGRVAEVHGDGY
jgi:hypothetical protein